MRGIAKLHKLAKAKGSPSLLCAPMASGFKKMRININGRIHMHIRVNDIYIYSRMLLFCLKVCINRIKSGSIANEYIHSPLYASGNIKDLENLQTVYINWPVKPFILPIPIFSAMLN